MTQSTQIAILSSLLIGLAATSGTIFIHGLVVHNVIIKMCRNLKRGRIGMHIWENLAFIASTTLLSLVGHFLEVTLWAFVFDLCGGVADLRAALYCSAGNYTTLGSGNVILSQRWKLLGPIEATAGVLMFGISTALIFAVIQTLIQARLMAQSAGTNP
jgi:Ion channel